MEPCKGCRHFENALLGPYCMRDGEWVSHIEPLSGERVMNRSGELLAKDMRAPKGECGPERRLYETNGQAFKKWLKALKNDICIR